MIERDAFEAAIKADPLNRQNYAIYHDWLEDHGEHQQAAKMAAKADYLEIPLKALTNRSTVCVWANGKKIKDVQEWLRRNFRVGENTIAYIRIPDLCERLLRGAITAVHSDLQFTFTFRTPQKDIGIQRMGFSSGSIAW